MGAVTIDARVQEGESTRRFDDPDVPLGTLIAEAVAAATGRDATDLALYEAVDLDAVEALHRHGGTDWTLSFEVESRTVVVEGDGEIRVR
ncbi:HalOD1 output domain-containing protein [Halorarius halobius]|uniref:HalOD1 output domain-containing protein n=1 Tax=Halorarius halobius TaxID=2962671 RepID=UPI0020CB8B74|nr:HalOD1 output domain-containing protein [Halorarius halobius]